jgi:hypothetical protein
VELKISTREPDEDLRPPFHELEATARGPSYTSPKRREARSAMTGQTAHHECVRLLLALRLIDLDKIQIGDSEGSRNIRISGVHHRSMKKVDGRQVTFLAALETLLR